MGMDKSDDFLRFRIFVVVPVFYSEASAPRVMGSSFRVQRPGLSYDCFGRT